jgi:acetyl esterase/lipase
MIEKLDHLSAQDGAPPDVLRAVAEMGASFDLEVLKKTAALYAPLVRAQPQAGVSIQRDLAYGQDERQRIDVFRPAARGPVIVFVHGGGFVAGDKNVDADFYSNIGVYFARRGCLAITMNYRRAPQHLWPSAAQDVASVVAWAKAHAAEHNGDPENVFLFGQSAGACHVAGYLFSPELQPPDGSGISGGVLMSGVYRAFGPDAGPGISVYFGQDEAARRANCPIAKAASARTPLLVGVMEFDPPNIAVHTTELVQALRSAGREPAEALCFAGHNHASTVYSLGSGQDDIGEAIMQFVGGRARA